MGKAKYRNQEVNYGIINNVLRVMNKVAEDHDVDIVIGADC